MTVSTAAMVVLARGIPVLELGMYLQIVAIAGVIALAANPGLDLQQARQVAGEYATLSLDDGLRIRVSVGAAFSSLVSLVGLLLLSFSAGGALVLVLYSLTLCIRGDALVRTRLRRGVVEESRVGLAFNAAESLTLVVFVLLGVDSAEVLLAASAAVTVLLASTVIRTWPGFFKSRELILLYVYSMRRTWTAVLSGAVPRIGLVSVGLGGAVGDASVAVTLLMLRLLDSCHSITVGIVVVDAHLHRANDVKRTAHIAIAWVFSALAWVTSICLLPIFGYSPFGEWAGVLYSVAVAVVALHLALRTHLSHADTGNAGASRQAVGLTVVVMLGGIVVGMMGRTNV